MDPVTAGMIVGIVAIVAPAVFNYLLHRKNKARELRDIERFATLEQINRERDIKNEEAHAQIRRNIKKQVKKSEKRLIKKMEELFYE